MQRPALYTVSSLSLLLLAGCPVDDDDSGDDDDIAADVCADSVPGTVSVFATGFESTEGITFSDDGRLFVGGSDIVAEVQPDGTWAEVASVPGVIGLAWWNGALIAASSDSGLGNGADGVFRVDVESGDITLIGDGIPGANFVTVTPWDSLIVSDPIIDDLQELTADGEVSTWLSGALSANGTAFTADGSALWSVATFGSHTPVLLTPVEDGVAGEPEEIAAFSTDSASDGVAVGESGALYIVQNIGARVDRVQRDGTVDTIAVGVDWGASIAFGEGEGWDPCSVYATSLYREHIFRVEIGEVGLSPLR